MAILSGLLALFGGSIIPIYSTVFNITFVYHGATVFHGGVAGGLVLVSALAAHLRSIYKIAGSALSCLLENSSLILLLLLVEVGLCSRVLEVFANINFGDCIGWDVG